MKNGRLQALKVDSENNVSWVNIKDVSKNTLIQGIQLGAKTFKGAEGIEIDNKNRKIYFVTKWDNLVWEINLRNNKLSIFYNKSLDNNPQSSGLDNICLSNKGSIFIAEDGGNMEIVNIREKNKSFPILRINGQSNSEITGIYFTKDMKKLYFSSQRGKTGNGITYEVEGDFDTYF